MSMFAFEHLGKGRFHQYINVTPILYFFYFQGDSYLPNILSEAFEKGTNILVVNTDDTPFDELKLKIKLTFDHRPDKGMLLMINREYGRSNYICFIQANVGEFF